MKKRIRGRRAVAMGRIATALAVMLLLNQIFGVLYLLPMQAVRQQEQRSGLFHTDLLCRRWTAERGEGVYLTANRYGMQASVVTWQLGWNATGAVLEYTGGEPLYIGEMTFRNGEQSPSHDFFGRLGNWDIKRLEIGITYTLPSAQREEKTERFTIGEDDFLNRNGERYFLVRHFTPEDLKEAVSAAVVTAYNAKNEVLFSEDVQRVLAAVRLNT